MSKKILHVEDDEDTRNLVKLLLRRHGYSIVSVSCGEEGLDMLERYEPDLVLLDVMLPDMSGWDIYQKIRKSSHSIKVAFLSIIPVSEERLDILRKNGIADYIMKPFDNDDLVRRIGKIL